MTKKKKKYGKAKATGEGLEGFLDRTNPAVSQSAEEIEAKMSGLFVRFATRMHKRAANTQERTTPDLEVPGDKRLRPSRFEEEVQADPVMITMDSPEQVLEAPSTVQDASSAELEDEIPARESPRVDDASIEASLVKATDTPPRARWASLTIDGVQRPLDRLVLSSYVELME